VNREITRGSRSWLTEIVALRVFSKADLATALEFMPNTREES